MKKLFCFLIIVTLFTFSCKKAATPVPTPPVISYASFTTSSADNARLILNFHDVDGDIGYQLADQTNTNIDFYMRYYNEDPAIPGKFNTFYYAFPNGTPLGDSAIYTYHIPYVTDNIKDKILDGQIIIDLAGYKPGDLDSLNNFRYEFWIFDRAGHKSNVVTTPAFHTPY
ncbi:MAG: hypothetical protein ABI388_12405 [Bacteroidia bacterium]